MQCYLHVYVTDNVSLNTVKTIHLTTAILLLGLTSQKIAVNILTAVPSAKVLHSQKIRM